MQKPSWKIQIRKREQRSEVWTLCPQFLEHNFQINFGNLVNNITSGGFTESMGATALAFR